MQIYLINKTILKSLNSLSIFFKKNGFMAESNKILKLAGVFSPPPKMVKNLSRWARQKVAGGLLHFLEEYPLVKDNYPLSYQKLSKMTKTRNHLFTSERERIRGHISLDLNDWEYFEDERFLSDDKMNEINIQFKKLYVSIYPTGRESGRRGSYGWGLELNPYNPFFDAKKEDNEIDWDAYFYELETTIEHELIHFGQNLLNIIIDNKSSPIGKSGIPPVGMGVDINKNKLSQDPELARRQQQYLLPYEAYTYLNNDIRAFSFMWSQQEDHSEGNFKNLILDFISNSEQFKTWKQFNKPLYKKLTGIFFEHLIDNLEIEFSDKPHQRIPNYIGYKVVLETGNYKGLFGVIDSVDDNIAKVKINIFGRIIYDDVPLESLKFLKDKE